MWIITREGVALNVDQISKIRYREPDTVATVAGQTTIVATGDMVTYILGAIANREATIDFRGM